MSELMRGDYSNRGLCYQCKLLVVFTWYSYKKGSRLRVEGYVRRQGRMCIRDRSELDSVAIVDTRLSRRFRLVGLLPLQLRFKKALRVERSLTSFT